MSAPACDQHAGHLVAPVRDGPHQRGLSAHRLLRVHLRALRQERLDDARRCRRGRRPAAAIRRRPTPRWGWRPRRAAGRPSARSRSCWRRAAASRRGRCAALTLAPASISHPGHLDVVPVRRPVEDARAVRLDGLDVGALIEERPDGGAVLALDRVDQPQVAVGRAGRRGPQERDEPDRAEHAAPCA